jgi:hypothetical protein
VRLNKLSLKDKEVFLKYLSSTQHDLSVYNFANIYIWKGLFDIFWTVIKESLCVFFKDNIGCFLYLPPLTKTIKPEAITEAFKIMDGFNRNKDISRIENIEDKDVPFYQNLGYTCRYKSSDYLCLKEDLVQLRGNRFKSKRACFNYFIKHYPFHYLPYSLDYRDDCLKLYNSWRRNRKAQNKNSFYKSMLDDSLRSLKILLDAYSSLDCLGRVVRVDKEIKAFTFGFKLNKDTFCILYEIADLSIKGLSQFIFRNFCSESESALEDCKYINIMDDSGLENLKRVKLSCRPLKLISAYIVTRKK